MSTNLKAGILGTLMFITFYMGFITMIMGLIVPTTIFWGLSFVFSIVMNKLLGEF